MPDINMPKLSDTMEEGTIVDWKESGGDEVPKGEVLAEVDSDKATFDLEAEDDGTLEILVEKGVPAKIGAPIARSGSGSPAAAPPKPAAKAAAPAKAKAEPKAEAPLEAEPVAAESPVAEETPAAPSSPAPSTQEKPRVEPAENDGQRG